MAASQESPTTAENAPCNKFSACPEHEGTSIRTAAADSSQKCVTDGAAALLEEKNQALRLAAEQGDETTCKELLSAGADFDSFSPDDEEETTAFNLAARAGHEAVCRLFLKRGARVTYTSETVYLAAVAGHGHICKLLLESMREAGYNKELGKENGLTLNKNTLNKNTFALLKAAREGHIAACRLLLEAGAAINGTDDRGRTALHVAAYQGHVAVCRILLDKGADVTRATRPALSEATSLAGAALKGHVAVCELLLDRGADVGQMDGGAMTALYFAAH